MQSEPSLQRPAIASVRRALNARKQVAAADLTRMLLLAGGPVLLIGVLAWPLLFTNSPLGGDWAHHLSWLWSQSQEIRADQHPSLYLNYPHAVLYPHYAFYGGTIYALAGALSLLLGDAPVAAYVLTYVLGFAAAYGGWYWIATMAGLRRWQAQAPGLLFITSAYYVTLIYERGDWPEFLAVSTIPLLLASGLSVLRAERLRLFPALALASSGIVFFGSHLLTVIWGSTIIAVVCVLIAVFVPDARDLLQRRRVARVAAVLLPAGLVNAWFLLPLVAYESHTTISHSFATWVATLKEFMPAVSVANLFQVVRSTVVATGHPAFMVSLSVLAIGWVLIGGAVFVRKGLSGAWTRTLLVLAGSTALVTIVMTHAGLMLALPRPYATLQFSYRLDSFVLLGLSGSVLVVLVLLARAQPSKLVRLWPWALIAVLGVSIVGAIDQIDASPRGGPNRHTLVRPPTKPGPREEGLVDYLDVAQPKRLVPQGTPEIYFPPASLHDDSATRIVHFEPGQTVYSNVGGGPELVHVSGARIVGLSPDGNDLLEIEPGVAAGDAAGSGTSSAPTERISISPASPLPVTLGRVITLAAIALLLVELVVVGIRNIRPRHA